MQWLFFAAMGAARLIGFALIVLIVVRLVRGAHDRQRKWQHIHAEERALDRLGRRFALGEIDEAEYRARRVVLTE